MGKTGNYFCVGLRCEIGTFDESKLDENRFFVKWRPGTRFSKAWETFRARKATAKSPTLRLQGCFIHRDSLYTRSFKRIHFSVVSYTWTKSDSVTGPNSFESFRETAPKCGFFNRKIIVFPLQSLDPCKYFYCLKVIQSPGDPLKAP